jgi:hypothetical protein
VLFSRSTAKIVVLAVLLTALSACANRPNGNNLDWERILAADPRLRDNPVKFDTSGNPQQQTTAKQTPGVSAAAQLPPDFPKEIPLYPNAQLKEVTQPTTGNNNSGQANQPQRIIWVTSDPSNFVRIFYQKQFQANNWQILNQPPPEAQSGTIEARLNDLQVRVSLAPTETSTNSNPIPTPTQPNTATTEVGTQFTIQYGRDATQTAAPQQSEPGSINPTLPQETPTQPSATPDINSQTATNSNLKFTDLNKVTPQLRQYITDLVALGVLPLEQTGSKSNQADVVTQFEPAKTIARREFARWLVAANNQIHANLPSQQIREASPDAQPAFQDVPRTDPDFPVIQGLAEAGLIPSRLSGDATAVLFRPDTPLTREQLILWKVPLDTRQALPNASVEAVRESWGFQDVARIEPRALRAALADFQNGEQSNIRRVFGYTTLFQPKKPVTRAEAAAALWYFGNASEGISAQEALKLKEQPTQPSPTSSPVPSSSPSPDQLSSTSQPVP